ncbi:hypothetical protein CYMTET_28848, partial [Cymbomonas tetramitiformis]
MGLWLIRDLLSDDTGKFELKYSGKGPTVAMEPDEQLGREVDITNDVEQDKSRPIDPPPNSDAHDGGKHVHQGSGATDARSTEPRGGSAEKEADSKALAPPPPKNSVLADQGKVITPQPTDEDKDAKNPARGVVVVGGVR